MRLNTKALLRLAGVSTIALVMLCPAVWVCGQIDSGSGESGAADDNSAPSPDQPESAARLREGTKLENVAGRFAVSGDRIAFFPARDESSLPLLENLSLERVGQMLTTVGEERTWAVSGMVTEFQGKNFLLLSRATMKNEVVELPGDETPAAEGE